MRRVVFTAVGIITIGIIALGALYVGSLVGFRRAYVRKKELYRG